jgi:hypothetical protein
MEQDSIENQEPKATSSINAAEVRPEYVTVYPYSTFSYDTGFADGVLRLGAPKYYETFSENLEKKELAESLLERCRRDISRIETELRRIQTRTLELFSTAFDREEKIGFAETRLNEALKKREELELGVQNNQHKYETIEPEYSMVVAFIMLAVGLIFIGSDVLITQGIMQQALSMQPYEAWIIAVSISLTAFAIKPAIDRIFERPLRNNKKVLRNNVMLIIMSILIIVMLGFLGYFRSYAYLVNFKYAQNPEDALILKEWENLFISPTIITVFTIASILFAVVGALCLSIGFKSTEQHFSGIGLRLFKGKRLQKELGSQETKVFELREITSQYKKELRESQKEIELMPAQNKLEMRLAGLNVEEKDLMMLIAEANTTAQAAWYKEGAARGERFNVSGELFVSPIRTERWVVPEPIQGPFSGSQRGVSRPRYNSSPETARSSVSRSDDYLYQQIRSAIALHDNKNLKKTSSNGKQH